MQIVYKCCKCGEIYEWYDTLYENPEWEKIDFKTKQAMSPEERMKAAGVSIKANCFILKAFTPCDDKDTQVNDTDGNLKGAVINLCGDCMRKLLDEIHPFYDSGNCWWEV